ncbi:hypothetical protein HNY73_015025 [Argiope bruennichi]|uniref:Uncharacterized protein n=1 Tax=Argiope bruennichi TaxID=94029 RepID=A0A8T0ER54_ARGBR|nr:hypothetical protein HNY73_015025 [Argiope bruennichi]
MTKVLPPTAEDESATILATVVRVKNMQKVVKKRQYTVSCVKELSISSGLNIRNREPDIPRYLVYLDKVIMKTRSPSSSLILFAVDLMVE